MPNELSYGSHENLYDAGAEVKERKTRRAYGTSGNASGLLEYEGEALTPDKTTSEKYWRIRKYTYDGSGKLTQVDYANNNDNFKFAWDNRTDYTYG